jgi:peptidoglycan/xylan/chitin deacetylase (PgdA/CDA1 family)
MLADQLAWLADEGYAFVPLASVLETAAPAGPRSALIVTFDDGYSDFLTSALPILQRCGVPVAVFLVTDLLGQSARWTGSNPQARLLSAAQARTVKKLGVTLGSHTLTHADLTALRADELSRQLTTSRQALIDLGETFYSLAYPWGQAGRREAAAARTSGYQCALLAGPGAAGPEPDRHRLGRLMVSRRLDLRSFGRVVRTFRKPQPLRQAMRTVVRITRSTWRRRA